jgi:hypothetical protein
MSTPPSNLLLSSVEGGVRVLQRLPVNATSDSSADADLASFKNVLVSFIFVVGIL